MPTDPREICSNLNVTGKFSKIDISQTPKVKVDKALKKLKTSLDTTFDYTDKEVEMLTQHPLILRRLKNWGENLSPEYLVQLKKKQRQLGT